MAAKPKTPEITTETTPPDTTIPPFDIGPYLQDIADGLKYHSREMPDATYKALKQKVDRAIMERDGYEAMMFGTAMHEGLTDLVTFERTKAIVEPVKVGGLLWEFKGGAIAPNDLVWAK